MSLLVRHFIEKLGKADLVVTPAAMESLVSYNYPGNVRELKYSIEMAVTLCRGNKIEPCCLSDEIRGAKITHDVFTLSCNGAPLTERVRTFERETIRRVLEEANGKKEEAAKKLGISRETLWRKLKEHGFSVSPSDSEE